MKRALLYFFTRLCLAFAIAVMIVAAPSDARADDPPPPPLSQALPQRGANYTWDRMLLRAGFSYRDVMDRAMQDKLSTGLPTVIAMRAYVIRDGATSPVALSIRTCRVVYDLWDEVYRIRVSSSGGERESAAVNVEGVLRQCAEVRDQPILDRTLLEANKSYYLGVIVEVNPANQQMVEQMRRWVSKPAGATSIGPGDALFGSFAGLFVRQLVKADRTLLFRTPSFTLPPPAPPPPP
jgi:hypothetical protein